MRFFLILCLFVLAAHRVESAPKECELPSGKECLPGSSWKSQCNRCTCSADGIAVCTLALCSGYENEPEKTCAPNTEWKNECNNCRCSAEGQGACTLKECTVSDSHGEE